MQFTMYQWELPSEEITLFENTASGAILPLNNLYMLSQILVCS